jgi:hypothetical protein
MLRIPWSVKFPRTMYVGMAGLLTVAACLSSRPVLQPRYRTAVGLGAPVRTVGTFIVCKLRNGQRNS